MHILHFLLGAEYTAYTHQSMIKWLYGTFSEEQSLVLGWAGMMGIIEMCYLLE